VKNILDEYTKKCKIRLNQNETYINAIDGGDIGVWEWDIEDNSIFISDKCFDITESHFKEVKNLYDFIDSYVISQDKRSALNDLNYFLNGNSYIYRSEFRVIDKEGNNRWILLKGKAIKEDKKIISGIMDDLSLRKRLEDEIKTLAYVDSLTEISNRNLFEYDFNSILEECKNNNKKGALIFIDIDNFKQVNDIFGHDYGDILLKVFSQILNISIKDYGKVYRLSGDEFIILVNKFSSKKELQDICENLLESCKEPFEIKDEQIYISVSMGIAIFPDDSSDKNQLKKFIDLSMYYSKNTGKNRYTFFDEKIYDVYLRDIVIEQEMKNAIENDELYLMYQPQVDIKNNRIIGFEALIRWNNKKLGNISPAEFIPLAEKNGEIINIGAWVIKSACKKIKELINKGYKFGTMSVNVSPIQFKKVDLYELLVNICKENEIDSKVLEIEITEGTLIDLYKGNTEILNKLIQKGFRIAIDDFGTGYSSLNYLTMLPINTLKIDKSFVDNIHKEQNQAVIRCILELSRTLKYDVIAEGVEDKEQKDILMSLGCRRIQGYYFSKPICEDEIEELLNKI